MAAAGASCLLDIPAGLYCIERIIYDADVK
jgi:hypothetical protein